MDDMVYWIIGTILVLCIAFVLYCCCWVAGRADAQSEAFYRKTNLES